MQYTAIRTSRLERLPVDENEFVAIQHACFAVQAQSALLGGGDEARQRHRLLLRREPDRGLGLGQVLAEEDGDIVRLGRKLRELAADLVDHLVAELGRMLAVRKPRVGIAARQLDVVGHEVQEGFPQFLPGWRAEAYRVGHALADRLALMCPLRRQVEHVTRFEHVFVRGREIAQDLHRQAFDQ